SPPAAIAHSARAIARLALGPLPAAARCPYSAFPQRPAIRCGRAATTARWCVGSEPGASTALARRRSTQSWGPLALALSTLLGSRASERREPFKFPQECNSTLGGVTFGMNAIVLDGVGAQIELPGNVSYSMKF